MSKLKEDFPGFAALDAAGEATAAKVRKRIAAGTLTEIEGIGDSTAEKITAAFEEIDSPDAQAREVADADDNVAGENPAPGAGKGADVISEPDARAEAITPELKQARLETNAEKLAKSRFCFYDDPEGPFVADADTVIADDLSSKRVKVMPISLSAPVKGLEVRDSGDVYVITEDMMAENVGDWLKVRSPVTGLPLIR